MKLNCPSCAAPVEVDDALGKRLVACPHCASTFVPANAAKVAEMSQASSAERGVPTVSDELTLDASLDAKADRTSVQKPEPKFCPDCGASWKLGIQTCYKCRYNIQLEAKMPAPPKERKFKFDGTQLYILLTAGAVIAGVYYVAVNGNQIYRVLNSLLFNKPN